MNKKPIFGAARRRSIRSIRPAPENDLVYRKVTSDVPALITLAQDIQSSGQLEPIMVSSDGWIISGHRRYAAMRTLNLKTVNAIEVRNISRRKDSADFRALLVSYNANQREKSFEEKVRERTVLAEPDDAYRALIDRRAEKEWNAGVRQASSVPLDLGEKIRRKEISPVKRSMADAIIKIIADQKAEGFPHISERHIHYRLFGRGVNVYRTTKTGRLYENDKDSTKDLSDLLTRLRIKGEVDPAAIVDETRPIETWQIFGGIPEYFDWELRTLMNSYRRSLLQTQPDHIELVVEKNTVRGTLYDLAEKYCIPLTSGRGYSSFPPRWQIAQRYRLSGKARLILILVSDFDPDGEAISKSFARTMRDDFGLDKGVVHAFKAALRLDQIKELDLLPSNLEAKKASKKYPQWVADYGTNQEAYELEAVSPATLVELVEDVLKPFDYEAFNREVEQERADATELEAVRESLVESLRAYRRERTD